MSGKAKSAITSEASGWLIGGGEMGRLIREMDWSKSPLGPIKSWPQSLRAAVSICLNSKFPMVIWWGADQILIHNDSSQTIMGRKRQRALGRPGREIWPEVWGVLGPMLEAVMATGQATWSDNELLFINRSGYTEETYFTWSYSPIRDESGNIGGVFTAVTETTERIVGERRMRTLCDLAAYGAQAREITEACRVTAQALAGNPRDIPFALLYLLNDDNQARLVGAAGVQPGTEVSPPVVDLREEAAGATAWPLIEVARTARAEVIKNLRDKFGYLPDEPWRERPREAIVAPITLPGREAPSLLLALAVSPRRAFDEEYHNFFSLVVKQVESAITNVVAYEQESKRAEALAELDRAKTAFFSNISHELRTPLTLMLGSLEETLDKGELTPQTHERLEVARRNSLRLLKQINLLLDFSRIEAGRAQAIYEPVDLATLTADSASVFRSTIENAGIKLTIDCPRLAEAFYVDREMWEKIVLNLISNAFKFTFKGEIEVSLKSVGKLAELTVCDTGVGIPAEELTHVFERFRRVKGASGRSYEGSGIGLALVQEIAKLHGGTARAESEPGRGSRFIVSIPKGYAHLPADQIGAVCPLDATGLRGEAYVEEALRWMPEKDEAKARWRDGATDHAERHEVEDAVSPRPPGAPAPPARILLADDNADMRDYVRQLLATNHEVEAVSDGEAALESARHRPPDLILTDVMMPKLDGVGLLRELRADEELKNIPVILLSARAGEESRLVGVEAGADDYLIKPFSARELIARVETHLKLQRVRKETVEALRASERKFSTAFEQSPLSLVITSLGDERIVEVNEGFVRLSGYARDEAIGRTSEELNLWVEPEQRAEWLKRLRAGEQISGFETRLRAKNGEERAGVIEASLIEINSRPHILSSIVDITERKRMEELLRESRERLRFALESAQVGDWDLDLITGNAERSFIHDKCFGATEPFEEWSYEKFLTFVHPDDLAEVEQAFGKAIAEQTGWHFECRVVWQDASIHWIEASGRIYHMIGGSPARMLGVVTDITGRKQAEEEIARLLAEEQAAREMAEQATRAKDEFLAMVSHELRSPLNAILGWNRLLRLMRHDDPQIAKVTEIVENSGKAQLRLIEDLLDTARIISGKMRLETQPVELMDVISSALNTVRPAADSKNIVIVPDLDPDAGQITGDPNRLQQIVWNLASNAIKFTPEGGWVQVELRRGGPGVQIIVRDSGQGISPDLLPYIFDWFKQADSSVSRRFGGLGLGLALVKHLVELHGGSVTAESPGESQGSTFTVNLPAPAVKSGVEAKSSREGETIVARLARFSPQPTTLSGIRALVVEDKADARELITLTLEQHGAVVTGVDSAAAALAALESQLEDGADRAPFDVLISDIGMPGAGGYELMRRVRHHADERVSGIPAIALTAYVRAEDRQQALQAGFQMHVPKPVDAAELTTVIAALTGYRPGDVQEPGDE